jgi:hypothetical protein
MKTASTRLLETVGQASLTRSVERRQVFRSGQSAPVALDGGVGVAQPAEDVSEKALGS